MLVLTASATSTRSVLDPSAFAFDSAHKCIDLNSNHLCSTRSAKSHYTSFHRSGGSEVVKGKKVLNDI